jgi:hypothetical protein
VPRGAPEATPAQVMDPTAAPLAEMMPVDVPAQVIDPVADPR